MGIAERMSQAKVLRENLIELKTERAKEAALRTVETTAFKITLLNSPEAKLALNNLIKETIKSITDPVADFLDVLKAKGFRQAEIRNIVRRLYELYCVPVGNNSEEVLYEEMLPAVAEYLYTHQELYNTLNPEDLRSE